MYVLVDTDQKKAIFDSIWQNAWNEKGYELEFTAAPFSQILISIDGEYVAAMEFKRLAASSINEVFPFGSHAHIQRDWDKTMEIDKLSILPEYRGLKTLKAVLHDIGHFSIDHEISGLVALIEPRLFVAIKRHYRKDVKQLEKAFYYKGDDVVPMSLDTRNLSKASLTDDPRVAYA